MSNGLPDKLTLEIVTPDELLFGGDVDEVTVPGVDGYLGILPGHAPLLSELQIGIISYRRGSQYSHLFCGWGFVEVLSDRVSVLAEIAQSPELIDVDQARADQKRAEQLLRSKEPGTDYKKAIETLRKATSRLEVVERSRQAA